MHAQHGRPQLTNIIIAVACSHGVRRGMHSFLAAYDAGEVCVLDVPQLLVTDSI